MREAYMNKIITYDPLDIANFFIKKGLEDGEPITQLKLVKLAYISHGWYLGLTGNPLITDAVEAWKYGPVIPKIYHEFKNYGTSPVDSMGTRANFSGETFSFIAPEVTDSEILKFLDRIYEVYGDFTASQLVEITHKRGTPWHKICHAKGGKDGLGVIIPNDDIEHHYKEIIQKNNARRSAANR